MTVNITVNDDGTTTSTATTALSALYQAFIVQLIKILIYTVVMGNIGY